MKILVLPGDGIGPEIVDAAMTVLRAVDAKHRLGSQIEKFPAAAGSELDSFSLPGDLSPR